jgi:polyvinyl alcohol dehydrogenase (cytochrome)
MKWRAGLRRIVYATLPSFGVAAAIAQAPPRASGALEQTFEQSCAVCHNNPATRAPSRNTLQAMSPSFIVAALSSGIMRAQGSGLSSQQRAALAEYLTGQKIAAERPMGGRCSGTPAGLSLEGPQFNGWGANVENWRFQRQPGLSAARVGQLELKWAFGIPGAVAMYGQPTIAAGRVFFGAQNGHVYSLDMHSGCYYWDFPASTGVRTAVTVARVGKRVVALFGDRRAHVYAVDASTGTLIWRVSADDGPAVQITGAPTLFDGRLYVPISVGDDSRAIDPKYPCCQGRGAMVALDATTGNKLWETYTLPELRPQAKNRIGTQLYGPSGASIWTSPTVDTRRRALYAGTGDNHSAPATGTSDAVLAFAMDTGAILWTRQLVSGDMGNGACLSADKTNCPEPHGPDSDLGASPNLITLADGKRVLTIGQKSGFLWALDPDDSGRIVWKQRLGTGGVLGGIQWGTATDGTVVYAAVSDLAIRHLLLGQPLVLDPEIGGGLHALAAATGATIWSAAPIKACGARLNCSPAQSAAVTATPEFVLSGSLDGHLRAYAAKDGRVLWDFDLAKPLPTVNGVEAHGGSIDSAGPTIAAGMVFVNSGYGLYGGQPGNVLAAFALPGPE